MSPGIDEPAPSSEQDDADREGDAGRPCERRAEAPQRRAAPGDERPDPHQQEQRQAEGAKEEVVVAGTEDPLLAEDRLVQDRIGDAPEDRQRERDEEQVVVEERRLPRDERLEPCSRPEQRQAREHERERPGDDEADEAEEPRARATPP